MLTLGFAWPRDTGGMAPLLCRPRLKSSSPRGLVKLATFV